jgi:hypothetical protein
MSTELSRAEGGKSLDKVQQGELAQRARDLERGGYYRNVVSPEDYIAGKNRYDSSNNEDLELNDEGSKDIESQGTKSQGTEVEPLKHWNTKIQKKFDECTDSQKQAWIDSFKIVEKGYVKQLTALKDDIAVAEPMLEAVSPYYRDIEKLGMTPKEYLERLINFDDKLGSNPAYEIARLISIHKLSYDDIYNQLSKASRDLREEVSIGKYVTPIQKELNEIKSALGYSEAARVNKAEAEQTADEIVDKITMFFEQKDSAGREMYPGAFDHMEDILDLAQRGNALEDAYRLAVDGKKSVSQEADVDYEETQGQGRRAELTPREKEKQLLLNTLKKITR